MIKQSVIDTLYLGDWKRRQLFEVTKTSLGLQDLAVNLDQLTGLQDDDLFRLNMNRMIPFEYEADLI